MKRFLLAALLALAPLEVAAQNTFFAASPGDMIYRGPSGWAPVPGGQVGQLLQSQGPTAQPSWTFDLSSVSQFKLPFMTTNTVLGNVTGGSANPTPITQSQFLDTLGFDIVRPPVIGGIPMKASFGLNGSWQVLQPGPSGYVLQSNGVGNDLTWAFNPTTATPGTAGLCLVSTGPSTPPAYAVCPITSANLTATAPLALSYGTPTTLALTGVVDVAHGGTGVATITSNGVVVGAGTSPITTKTGSTGMILASPGGVPTFTSTPSIAGSLTVPTITTGTLFATGGVNSNTTMTASTSVVAPVGTFATSTTSPIVYGGSAVGSTLALRPTSGAGSGGARVNIQGGTDGALQLGQFSGSTASASLSLGASGSIAGQLLFNGNTSGAVTMRPQAAAGNWQMILPSTPGTSGQFLTSNGNGSALTWTTAAGVSPVYGQNPVFINGALAVSAAGGALTIAVKTNAGADPSAGDPVTAVFRDVTGTTGTATVLSLTAANSLVVSSGSTLGVVSANAIRLWVVGINDAGTFRVGVVNLWDTANLFPLNEGIIAATTAEGGAGGADTAGVVYTGTATTNKALIILGYLEWNSSGVTAGTWTTSNYITTQMLSPGVHRPGDQVRSYYKVDSSPTTVAINTYATTGLSQGIIVSSAANVVVVEASGHMYNGTVGSASGATSQIDASILRGATAIGSAPFIFALGKTGTVDGVDIYAPVTMMAQDFPNTTSLTTYAVAVKTPTLTSVKWNPNSVQTSLRIQEIMR